MVDYNKESGSHLAHLSVPKMGQVWMYLFSFYYLTGKRISSINELQADQKLFLQISEASFIKTWMISSSTGLTSNHYGYIRVPDRLCWYSLVYSEPCQTKYGTLCDKTLHPLAVSYFRKMRHLSCLTGIWACPCDAVWKSEPVHLGEPPLTYIILIFVYNRV